MLCEPLPAMDGWSRSNRADADCESMDDWVASAAKEDVVSWYLHERRIRQGKRWTVTQTYSLLIS